MKKLKVKKLYVDAILPKRNNPTDSGLDLFSYEDKILSPITGKRCHWPDMHRVKIKTGIAVELEPGYGLFIHDRSGMSAKYGIHRVAGIVDQSYTGELLVALVNLSDKAYSIKKGDRIAQAVITPISLCEVEEVDELSVSSRGESGFGSSGT